MSAIGRISSLQRFTANRDAVLDNQGIFAETSSKLNSGQRLLNNYDQVQGARDLVQVTGLVDASKTLVANQSKAVTELELSESSLNSMKDILDKIKDDAITGASDTISQSDLEVIGIQLRNLGENLYQLANTKVGNKYLFGGLNSNLKVITHTPGALFANASYKEGQSDQGEREILGLQSSVSLSQMFTTSESSAEYTGTAVAAPLAANAELNLYVNTGVDDIDVGNIALSAGDTVANIVTKINAAFTAAGGSGAIAQEVSGKIQFDTALVTGNVKNDKAAVIIGEGDNLPNTLSDLGLTVNSQYGTSTNIRTALNNLDAAYNSNDTESIRRALVDIDANIDRLINAKSVVGDLVAKHTDAQDRRAEDLIDLEIQQSDIAKIPVAEAIQEVNVARTSLNAAMQASAMILQQNIFNFLRL